MGTTWVGAGRFAAAGVYSPLDLGAKLATWHKANDLASVIESGGAVSEWRDKSGNARHVLQATGSKKPLTGADTINSKNVLTFDGTDDELVVALSSVTVVGFYFVAELLSVPGASKVFIGHDYGSIYREAGGDLRLYSNGDLNSGQTIGADGAHLISALIAGGGASFIRKDGTGNTGSTSGTSMSELTFGANNDSTGFMNVNLAEIVTVNAALTAGESTALTDYLKTEWNTP